MEITPSSIPGILVYNLFRTEVFLPCLRTSAYKASPPLAHSAVLERGHNYGCVSVYWPRESRGGTGDDVLRRAVQRWAALPATPPPHPLPPTGLAGKMPIEPILNKVVYPTSQSFIKRLKIHLKKLDKAN